MDVKFAEIKIIAQQIEKNIDQIIDLSSVDGRSLWQQIQAFHPAELAKIFNQTSDSCVFKILEKMEESHALSVFTKLEEQVQAQILSHFDTERLVYFFKQMPADQLTTIFEHVPDKDLEKYLNLTKKKRRAKILSSLKSEDKTAGRILNSDVLILHKELTIKKVVSLYQQMDEKFDILPRQYVVSAELKLIGYIEIADLLKNRSDVKIETILKPIDVVAKVGDHQEKVASQIKLYDLPSIPVIDDHNNFLGVITTNDILDVLEEELTEDTYKMSGISGIDHCYVSVSFWRIVVQRCKSLIPLLLFQSLASFVMYYFEDVLTAFGLFIFYPMLVGTGGNVGGQSVAFFIRGLSNGEINRTNKKYVLMREVFISAAIGLILMLVSVLRVSIVNHHLPSIAAISLSLFFIIVTAVILGSVIPIVLHLWQIDPANSAAPIIATLMDILGITIYGLIAKLILK